MNKKMILGGITLFIIAVFFGVFFLVKNSNQQPIAPRVSDTAKVADRVEVADTAAVTNWQTYRNEEYGFEVKIPSDLALQQNTGESYISFSGKLNGKGYFLTFGNISQNSLDVMGVNYCQANPNESRCENFTSNNLNFLIDWKIEEEGAFTQSRAEILNPEGGMITIGVLHSPNQDVKLFFRQILSTFKFIK